MEQNDYDKQLLRWVRKHNWGSLEKDKDLIIRHLRTFIGDIVLPEANYRCACCGKTMAYNFRVCDKCATMRTG